MNKETAVANANLNRINQYTPEGSLVFNQIGTNADGTPKYESRQTYSPEQMQLYNSQLGVSNALSDLAGQNISRVQQAQSQPFNFNGMTPLQTNIGGYNAQTGYNPGGNVASGYNAGGNINYGYGNAGPITNQYGAGGNIQKGVANNTGSIQGNYASGGNVQSQYDYSKANALPGTADYGKEAKRVQDSVYNQATSRLDPQWQQQERQLAQQLAAKGVTENSEAYRRAMDQMTRQRTDAYNQATYSGIQAGSQEQSRLFGLALSGRQQGISEAQAQGQFGNQAQAQREAQNAARAQFGNQAAGQIFGQNVQAGQFANQAQQQANQQNFQAAQFGNTAQEQATRQMQERAGFSNAAQAQANQQNAAAAAFGNEAQNQRNQQNMQQAAFYNTGQGQNFQQGAAAAAFNNQARQQQIQEASYLRNLPLQDIAALMGTGGGISQPQFANYANANVAGTDYAGLVQNNYNNQMQQYNQKMAARNQGLGGIFGLAGSAAMAFSDRRLKTNIQRIGTLANGIKTYMFSYIGDISTQFGVMADEVLQVRPQAVAVHPSGYLMVDYGKVW